MWPVCPYGRLRVWPLNLRLSGLPNSWYCVAVDKGPGGEQALHSSPLSVSPARLSSLHLSPPVHIRNVRKSRLDSCCSSLWPGSLPALTLSHSSGLLFTCWVWCSLTELSGNKQTLTSWSSWSYLVFPGLYISSLLFRHHIPLSYPVEKAGQPPKL